MPECFQAFYFATYIFFSAESIAMNGPGVEVHLGARALKKNYEIELNALLMDSWYIIKFSGLFNLPVESFKQLLSATNALFKVALILFRNHENMLFKFLYLLPYNIYL